MIRTITIVDNPDGTQLILMNNISGEGEEIKIHKANFNAEINRFNRLVEIIKDDYKRPVPSYEGETTLLLKIDCKPNKSGEVFSMKTHNYNPSNEELIELIKQRGILTEEKVYRMN